MFWTKGVEIIQNTNFGSIKFFPRKSWRLCDDTEKIWYRRMGYRLQCNTARAHCVLDF